MNLLWILVVIFLIFAFVGAPSIGPWHHSYGWYPSGIGTVIVIVLVVLLLTGRLCQLANGRWLLLSLDPQPLPGQRHRRCRHVIYLRA
jgi:hypothetical protein